MEKHQKIAVIIFLVVIAIIYHREGTTDRALASMALTFLGLLGIFLYRVLAMMSGIGFRERLASDYGSKNYPGPYALFCWMLYLIICVMLVFELSIY